MNKTYLFIYYIYQDKPINKTYLFIYYLSRYTNKQDITCIDFVSDGPTYFGGQ